LWKMTSFICVKLSFGDTHQSGQLEQTKTHAIEAVASSSSFLTAKILLCTPGNKK
jgi:hypothetical protein